jgi:hypothetical protein
LLWGKNICAVRTRRLILVVFVDFLQGFLAGFSDWTGLSFLICSDIALAHLFCSWSLLLYWITFVIAKHCGRLSKILVVQILLSDF